MAEMMKKMIFPPPFTPVSVSDNKRKERFGGEREKERGGCHFWSHSATQWQLYLKTPGCNRPAFC